MMLASNVCPMWRLRCEPEPPPSIQGEQHVISSSNNGLKKLWLMIWQCFYAVLTPALSVSTPIISARNCCGKLKSFPENLYLHKSQGNGIVLEENSKRKPLRYGKAGRVFGGKGCRNLKVRSEWNGGEWYVWISRLTRAYFILLHYHKLPKKFEKSWCNQETECSSAPENLLEVHWQFPRNPNLFRKKR